LQSFRVMKTMVRRPAKPIPPDVLLLVLLIFSVFWGDSEEVEQGSDGNGN
jgi:hypothetical protein